MSQLLPDGHGDRLRSEPDGTYDENVVPLERGDEAEVAVEVGCRASLGARQDDVGARDSFPRVRVDHATADLSRLGVDERDQQEQEDEAHVRG